LTFNNFFKNAGETLSFPIPIRKKKGKKSFTFEDRHGDNSIYIVFGYTKDEGVLQSIVFMYKKRNMVLSNNEIRVYPWEWFKIATYGGNLDKYSDKINNKTPHQNAFINLRSIVDYNDKIDYDDVEVFRIEYTDLTPKTRMIYNFGNGKSIDPKIFSKFKLRIPLSFMYYAEEHKEKYMNLVIDLTDEMKDRQFSVNSSRSSYIIELTYDQTNMECFRVFLQYQPYLIMKKEIKYNISIEIPALNFIINRIIIEPSSCGRIYY
jgi:hypothetical protein